MADSWNDQAKAHEYVDRIRHLAPRQVGEVELLDALPEQIDTLLDLGCGDGRLADIALEARPNLQHVTAVDRSPPMLELARANLASSGRATVQEHDLGESISQLGTFDAVVSGFAIHHLAHERKRTLFGEIVEVLTPGGVFANLEVVQCATPALHAEFNRRIGLDQGDPEDVLALVEPQLTWMRKAGLENVDCQWRWRGFALLTGSRP